MKKILIVLFFGILLFHCSAVSATELSLSISPAVQRIIAKPGKQIRLIYNIKNTGDPTTLKVMPYILKPEHNLNQISPISQSQLDKSPHLEIVTSSPDDSPFLILSGENREIAVIIDIPPEAELKDYYFSIVAEAIPTGAFETSSQIDILGGLGSNIYLSVTKNGVTDSQVAIALFDVRPKYTLDFFGNKVALLDSFDKIPVELTVVNKGKNLARIITRLESSSFESDNRDLATTFIMAGAQKSLFDENDTLAGRFLGYYKISTKITINDTNVIYSHSSFLVFPFKYTLISLIAMIVVIYFILSNRKNITYSVSKSQ